MDPLPACRKDVLVICCGNPLRGDDGAGWHAAGQLEHAADGGTDIITCRQLMPELSETISRAGLVIFVDARQGETPGNIRIEPVFPSDMERGSFTHHFDPALLLSYAEKLYGKKPEAYLATVAGRSFDHEEKLSPETAAAMPALLEKIGGIIAQYRDKDHA